MPRRRVAAKREILPDPKFGSQTLAKFINMVMVDGKKSVAERILYGALDRVTEKRGGDPMETLETALENVRPAVEVRSKRVGGSNYQVPREVSPKRAQALAIRWIVNNARKKKGLPMARRLSSEFVDACNNTGASVQWKENVHKMAEANKAFSHYRW